jgi:ligand-binding SRPBCC domain-containing protein
MANIVLPHPEGAILRDEIDFEPPLPIFGPLAMPLSIMPRLEKMFAYRHEVTKRWCEGNVSNGGERADL